MLSNGLAKKQELQRQETINRVKRAMVDIKSEGRTVTISSLIEFTGLSRSTFSKPHIRELLVEYGYSVKNSAEYLSKLKNKGKKKLHTPVSEQECRITELQIKNAELERECELLRGRLFLAMQRG